MSPPRRKVTAVDPSAEGSDDEISEASFDFYKSIDLSQPQYQDLIPVSDKIKWRTDKDGVKWPRYDKVTVRGIKEIMKGRGLNCVGVRKDLVRRLTRDDRKRFIARGVLSRDYSKPASPDGCASDAEIQELMRKMASKAKDLNGLLRSAPPKLSPRRSKSVERPKNSAAPVTSRRSSSVTSPRRGAVPFYEDASSEASDAMEEDSDAEELFPGHHDS
jgi:hypothetical protein